MSRRHQIAEARAALNRAVRAFFDARGYLEVETPCLVPAPGQEPHIDALTVDLPLTDLGRGSARLYLHTSPEYAMKRLLADGLGRIWQLSRVFRGEPPSRTHNPEFTMLEFYREGDHHALMDDLEALVVAVAEALGADGALRTRPFRRATVAEVFRAGTGVALEDHLPEAGVESLAGALGRPADPGETWDDVFFRAWLDDVEPHLADAGPVFVTDWPAHMAALARLGADPRWADRFELYVRGAGETLELANGFFELNDPVEQRRRFEAEQAERASLGGPVYPLDEAFLEAVGRMPECAGVAVGVDRLLMAVTGAASIEDVLLFPARAYPGLGDED